MDSNNNTNTSASQNNIVDVISKNQEIEGKKYDFFLKDDDTQYKQTTSKTLKSVINHQKKRFESLTQIIV